MNKKVGTIILSALLFLVVLTGCKKPKDGAAGSAGATGPNLSGTLQGYVDLFDQYGNLMSNASGVYITIPGKSGTDSTSTAGIFTKNLSTGTYELDFAKTGYGAMKIPSVNFVGGGTQYINAHVQLSQPASFSLSSIGTGTLISQGANVITVTVTPSSTDTKARKVICFFSTSSSVSYLPGNYMGAITLTVPATGTTGTSNITTAVANAAGIVAGDPIYIIAYPISFNINGSAYTDVATGKNVFNNLNIASTVTTNTVFP